MYLYTGMYVELYTYSQTFIHHITVYTHRYLFIYVCIKCIEMKIVYTYICIII